MRTRLLLCLLAFAVIGIQNQVKAEITFTVDTVNALAGDTGVNVVVSASGSGTLTGYAFALDFGADGESVPSDLTYNFGVNPTNLAASNLDFISAAAGAGVSGSNYDLQVNHSAVFESGLVLNATGTNLFALQFDVDPGTPTGFFDVQILPFGSSAPNELFVLSGTDIGPPEEAQIVNGGINITAVPEPGTLALFAVAGFGIAIRRCRR